MNQHGLQSYGQENRPARKNALDAGRPGAGKRLILGEKLVQSSAGLTERQAALVTARAFATNTTPAAVIRDAVAKAMRP